MQTPKDAPPTGKRFGTLGLGMGFTVAVSFILGFLIFFYLPLKLTDLVGLDVRLAIAEHLHRELKSAAFEPPQLLREMVKAGKLGRKSGQGFYRYEKK